MTLPVTFATLASGSQNAALFDQQFAALGACVDIACTAAGSNAIVLTPQANTPTVLAYSNLTPKFVWTQAQTTTGSATIAVAGGLAALPAYRNNGQTSIGSGDLVAGNSYTAFYLSTLNSGGGGFVVDAFGSLGAGTLQSRVFYSASATITVPPSASSGLVQMWGATGGSGGATGGGATGGSGGGGYLEKLLTGLTSGNTLTYTQAAGGLAGVVSPGSGGNAGATTLSSGTQVISTLTCNGSPGTAFGTAAGNNNTSGSAGASATGGDINLTGQMGTSAAPLAVNGSISTYVAGTGGKNFFSRGADGIVGNPSAGNPGQTGGLIITWYS